MAHSLYSVCVWPKRNCSTLSNLSVSAFSSVLTVEWMFPATNSVTSSSVTRGRSESAWRVSRARSLIRLMTPTEVSNTASTSAVTVTTGLSVSCDSGAGRSAASIPSTSRNCSVTGVLMDAVGSDGRSVSSHRISMRPLYRSSPTRSAISRRSVPSSNSIGYGSSFARSRSAYSTAGSVNRPVVTTIPRFGPVNSAVATAEWSF